MADVPAGSLVAALKGFRDALQQIRSAGKDEPLLPTVAREIADWRQNETVAGAYALRFGTDDPSASLADAASCYYVPPDFTRVTWVPRDIPTPFVGFAPAPGPLASGSVNSMQFRYDREIQVPKPRGLRRIFLTGGSTAFSSGASSNATTIGGYLERYLNGAPGSSALHYEVVTAAACAWTSTHERIMIANRLIELQPDLVISLSGHNDAFWSIRGRNLLWFRSMQEDFFLSLMNSALNSHKAPEFPAEETAPDLETTAQRATGRLIRNVSGAHHALVDAGATYMFVLQPVLQASMKRRTQREQQIAGRNAAESWFTGIPVFYEEFRKQLQSLTSAGFAFVDAANCFEGCDATSEVFLDSCHFGDRGNDLIARSLVDPVITTIEAHFSGPSVR